MLCEHTDTSCNAKIVNSIIAPNTGVSSGECNSSLVGPFIGFHHNTLWYEGKGNIGYGANIGSNHTGRLPDQESIPGEGVFFGLGCNIKYPCNLLHSPYSIVASGVTMLPERVDMPFSLINKPTHNHESISPAFNISFLIVTDNYYMIIRNEDKFLTRNKSKRNTIENLILRPDIVAMIAHARAVLSFSPQATEFIDLVTMKRVSEQCSTTMGVGIEETQKVFEDTKVFLEQDIDGIGKNLLTEPSRRTGVNTYSFFIRLYLLRRLFQLLQETYENTEDYSILRLTMQEQWEGLQLLSLLTPKRV
ncbi:hypothetical protein JH06_1396 [Blastocystis sp. subtype 4]|uniref:hypothetical protein n=1 Tax=Blastocystis sp. subtype 4 TaxID=944170 RepID=UPI00071205C6|nr:hypothetical protein JH06_1396 [Blastocystis sp. subtype 4]KNB45351.1 hypothetical protein JH06_1396 [Blastocystis sp. subtype 4]|eukprot:XP_014528794.1 hypothetical protein JH06_1396 [Blastocystis sp. subtype 4]